MKNLSALLKKKTAVKKIEKPTRSTAPKKDLTTTADAMMRMSGKIEAREIPGHCAKHDKPFTIMYERRSRHHKFQIVKISSGLEDDNGADGFLSSLIAKRQSYKVSFDAEDFDFSGMRCPHCGYSDTFVQCSGCEQTVCGSRTHELENGDRLFACSDSCGTTGKLSPCDHMHGSKHKHRDQMAAVTGKKLLKQTRNSSSLRLGGPQTRMKRLGKK